MRGVALLALTANTVSFLFLFRHRSDHLNMRSTCLCLRNDLIANISVVIAAVLVANTGTLHFGRPGPVITRLFLSFTFSCPLKHSEVS